MVLNAVFIYYVRCEMLFRKSPKQGSHGPLLVDPYDTLVEPVQDPDRALTPPQTEPCCEDTRTRACYRGLSKPPKFHRVVGIYHIKSVLAMIYTYTHTHIYIHIYIYIYV